MSKDITWHQSAIRKVDRHLRNGHRSTVVWLTGMSGSGKSTLAKALEQELFNQGIHVFLLDGDNLRHGLNQNLGFSQADRKENVRRLGEVAKLFMEAGFVSIVSAISPFYEDRMAIRKRLQPGEFIEVYVKCSLAECERRDPKGLYQKARTGQISDFTGLHQPYEEPITPELVLDTESLPLAQCLGKLKEYVCTAISFSNSQAILNDAQKQVFDD